MCVNSSLSTAGAQGCQILILGARYQHEDNWIVQQCSLSGYHGKVQLHSSVSKYVRLEFSKYIKLEFSKYFELEVSETKLFPSGWN